jgi:dihydrolipoamide dehydrogenase
MIKESITFDLIVIGSGSGLDVANAAAKNGLSVALVEKNRMGGTCLNRGCIPSKLLIHSADIMESIRQWETFGITISGKVSIDFEKIVSRATSIINSQSEEIKEAYNRVDNPRIFHSECKFVGKKQLLLKETDPFLHSSSTTRKGTQSGANGRGPKNLRITANKILIASGSMPRIPKIRGLDASGFITSDEALRLKEQPATLTIVGGGYVCCELAHFFGSLGTIVNIIQIQNRLIPTEDEDISKKLTEIFSKKYNVYLGYSTDSVSKVNGKTRRTLKSNNENAVADDSKIYRVIAKNNKSGGAIKVESEQLLIAVGRIPNSDTLDLEETGVKLDEKGYVLTDGFLQTNVQDIYSLGDVVGRYPFKHSANLEALYAAHNIIHGQDKIQVDYTAIPHAIFTSPQIAAVGVSEQSLKQQGKKENKDYLKSIHPFINTGMGLTIEDHEGFVKFLVDKESRKILGCHIIGTDASVLIHEVVLAMKTSDSRGNIGTIDNINRAVHVHPALSEVVAKAASQI